MVYVDPSQLKWMPYVKSWVDKVPETYLNRDFHPMIIELFETYFESGLIFFKKNCEHAIAQVGLTLLT